MGQPTKADLERENRELREALEGVYDQLAEVLGYDDEEQGEETEANDK